MYLIGRPHPHKLDAQAAVERLIADRQRLVTSSEVLQEILHRYASTGRREKIQPAFDVLEAIVDETFAVERDDVQLAREVHAAHPNGELSVRDAVHVAVMRRRQITEILSFDGGFDIVEGIARLPS